MGDLEAAGEVATGALLGRALEPRAGEGGGGGHDSICLNCGTALIGPHCQQCGQAAHVHRSLGAIGHEILHGVAHFEGKLWRTLPLLAWRPGELTRRYIEGERARFVSPMALFLFSIFTMFAIFSLVGISPPSDIGPARSKAVLEETRKALVESRDDAVEAREALATGDPKRAQAEARIVEIEESIKAFDTTLPKKGPDHLVRTGWALLDHGSAKWEKNPSLMLYKLQASIYKFSWLLIPLSLPFMWLMFFWKRQYHLYDHTVFITYSIAFMSLLFIAVTLLAAIGVSAGWLVTLSFVVPFVHLFRQLQQAYRLRWFSALLRTLLLSWFILIILILFLMILLALGMFG